MLRKPVPRVMSLSSVLEQSDLTTLSVLRQGDEVVCSVSREWDRGQDFSGYGRRFSSDSSAHEPGPTNGHRDPQRTANRSAYI